MGNEDGELGSRDRFAQEVLSAVRSAGVAEVWYDADEFAIGYRQEPGDAGGGLNLGNVYHAWQGIGAAERAERIAGMVDTVLNGPALPETWATVSPQLRPVLRASAFMLSVPDPEMAPLRRPAMPYLHEMIVVDQPTTMAYVTAGMVASWGVPPEEVFATAYANLAAISARPEPTGGSPVLRFVDSGDDYMVSQLLLPGWLAGLAPVVGGRPVAFVPGHLSLTVVADEPEVLARLFEMVEEEYRNEARPISPQAYTVDPDGEVVPYPAPDGHPLAAAVSRADAILGFTEYKGQTEWLNEELDLDGIGVFVASVLAGSRPDGSPFTIASWGDDVDTLLPRAEYVAFSSTDAPPFLVPWEVVEREVNLVPVNGLDPARYRLSAWPPAPVIDRLRAQSVRP